MLHNAIQLFQFSMMHKDMTIQWTQNHRQRSVFSNFYYNYLYITDLLQLLHSQTWKEKDKLENIHRCETSQQQRQAVWHSWPYFFPSCERQKSHEHSLMNTHLTISSKGDNDTTNTNMCLQWTPDKPNTLASVMQLFNKEASTEACH